jgi:hypothetical protein
VDCKGLAAIKHKANALCSSLKSIKDFCGVFGISGNRMLIVKVADNEGEYNGVQASPGRMVRGVFGFEDADYSINNEAEKERG